MYTAKKIYQDLPFAHRQPDHMGHCSRIHGHSWTFEFIFGCDKLDRCGFVLDLGNLRWLKDWIKQHFDHTLVLNKEDPCLEQLRLLAVADITVVPNCSMEGIAKYLYDQLMVFMEKSEDGETRGLKVLGVKVTESMSNSATYSP